jgi:nucleotide-binding universal stress UspA family protein
MQKILFPTDFSETTANALEYTVDLTLKANAELLLVNAFDLDFLELNKSADSYAMKSDESKSKLEALKEKLVAKHTNLKVDAFAAYGDAVAGINDVAKIRNIDLILMGTKGATGIKQFFSNSVTYDVIENASCPVLVIPEDMSFSPISKIMFATDYGNTTQKHIQFIRNLALIYQAEVYIVHINTAESKIAVSDAVEGLKIDSILGNEVSHKFEFIEDDNILEGIGNYLSKNEDIDLLTMVARERMDWFDSLSNPSTTKSIIHHPFIASLIMKD